MTLLKQVYTQLCGHAATLIAIPAAASAAVWLRSAHDRGELAQLLQDMRGVVVTFSPAEGLVCEGCTLVMYYVWAAAALLVILPLVWMSRRKQAIYLIDFAVHKAPESWRFPKDWFLPLSKATGKFTDSDLEFQKKILDRSGLGDETTVPPSLTAKGGPVMNMTLSRSEFEQTCFSAVADLLNKTSISPRQIKIVVVNSSLFNPTPSLSASIMNHFKMSSSTINYSLGGMGCSAGVVAIDLARQMLELYPNTYALVVSHENLTANWYPGNQKSMLIPNCIFRSNGAAMLLSNKPSDGRRAKYALQHVVRTNLAANDAAFQCVYEQEDDSGNRGVKLSKELMATAGQALKVNMTTLGPKVLPVSEQLLFAANLVAAKLLGKKKVKPYVPDFGLAFKHICIHTGGRAVVDEIEKQLHLTAELVEPTRATLYRYGNVSSTSIWYVLAYIESCSGVKRGERVWQLSFGSGFKCNSAVWVANRRIKDAHVAWQGFNVAKMYADLAAMDAGQGLAVKQ